VPDILLPIEALESSFTVGSSQAPTVTGSGGPSRMVAHNTQRLRLTINEAEGILVSFEKQLQ
jgi:hypothetical protein